MKLGRQDNLESLTYVLFYFLWGSLPWQGLGEEEAILESKRTITMHTLFLALLAELQAFYEHCRSLSFNEKPNYDHFYNLFGELILREGFHSTWRLIGMLLAAKANWVVRIRVWPLSTNAIILPSMLHDTYPAYLVLTINILTMGCMQIVSLVWQEKTFTCWYQVTLVVVPYL